MSPWRRMTGHRTREGAMDEREKSSCPECDPLTRRDFLKSAGVAVVATAAALPAARSFAVPKATLESSGAAKPLAETVVKTFYDSLTPRQREKMVFPWSHPHRTHVEANWAIVNETVDD